MPSSIVSSLLSTFDSGSIREIASRFGQPKEAVAKSLESSTACLLWALANKAGDSTWMSELFKLVSKAPSNVNLSDLMGAVTDPTRASSAHFIYSELRTEAPISRLWRQSVFGHQRNSGIQRSSAGYRNGLDEHGRADDDYRSGTGCPQRSHEPSGTRFALG